MKLFSNYNLKLQRMFSRGAIREGGRNPYVDWTLILIVSVIVLAVLVFASVRLFKKINNGLIQNRDQAVSQNVYKFDEKMLDDVIEGFKNKADRTSDIKKNYQFVPDPSI